MDFIDEKIEGYACHHSDDTGQLLKELEKETHSSLEIPQMLTGRIEGRFLKMLANLIQAKRIIEVGTFSGYSALSMAEALPPEGQLFTCDIDPLAIAMAKKYFSKSKHGSKVTLLEGPAIESIKSLNGFFDMAFIDADKINYSNYYEALLPLIRPGGLIAVDNVLWSGSVLDPKEESAIAIHQFNENRIEDDRVEKVLLTVRDGLLLLRKKS